MLDIFVHNFRTIFVETEHLIYICCRWN